MDIDMGGGGDGSSIDNKLTMKLIQKGFNILCHISHCMWYSFAMMRCNVTDVAVKQTRFTRVHSPAITMQFHVYMFSKCFKIKWLFWNFVLVIRTLNLVVVYDITQIKVTDIWMRILSMTIMIIQVFLWHCWPRSMTLMYSEIFHISTLCRPDIL